MDPHIDTAALLATEVQATLDGDPRQIEEANKAIRDALCLMTRLYASEQAVHTRRKRQLREILNTSKISYELREKLNNVLS